eukprot:5416472-Prymnesium_polylepis.1
MARRGSRIATSAALAISSASLTVRAVACALPLAASVGLRASARISSCTRCGEPSGAFTSRSMCSLRQAANA